MNMTTDANAQQKSRIIRRGGNSDAIYGFGVIGAWIYFVGKATTVWMVALGILKGIIWPGILVYELLKYLKI
jgi:hypothetical protein